METHVNASLINGEKYVFDTELEVVGIMKAALRVVCKHALIEVVWRSEIDLRKFKLQMKLSVCAQAAETCTNFLSKLF